MTDPDEGRKNFYEEMARPPGDSAEDGQAACAWQLQCSRRDRIPSPPEQHLLPPPDMGVGQSDAPTIAVLEAAGLCARPEARSTGRVGDQACLEIWTRALEEGFEVNVVYIDFRKAFDIVPQQRLLHKLSAIGIREDLLNWIRAFLVGRKQRVCIGDDMSESVNVTSGVPQGSVLGPLLFILYVNDSLQELDCGKIMFADDVKLWQVIKGPNDQRSLQDNLHRLQAWSKKWLLDFNVEKCAILHLRLTNSHSNESLSIYHLKNIRLPAESSQKDLGLGSLKRLRHTMPTSSRYQRKFRAKIGLVGHLRTQCQNPTTPPTVPTITPIVIPARVTTASTTAITPADCDHTPDALPPSITAKPIIPATTSTRTMTAAYPPTPVTDGNTANAKSTATLTTTNLDLGSSTLRS
nr:unnamed protein product [Spirometra erinaceieuropaei]